MYTVYRSIKGLVLALACVEFVFKVQEATGFNLTNLSHEIVALFKSNTQALGMCWPLPAL